MDNIKETDKRKNKERVLQKNKKTSWNQTLQYKSHQMNEYLYILPYKKI